MQLPQTERLYWTVLTVLGLLAGLALALPLGVPIFAVLGAMVGTPVVLGIVGLSLGTAQWPVIRRHISSSGWWIVGSTLGMAVGLTLGVTLVEQIGRAVVHGQINFRVLGVPARATSFGIIGLVAGAALGLAQWLVLRRHTANCTQWIRVNALSLGAGLASGSLLADAAVRRSGSFASTAILLLIAGVTAAVSTARALTSLFATQRTSAPTAGQ